MNSKSLSLYIEKIPFTEISVVRWLIILLILLISGFVFYAFTESEYLFAVLIFLAGIPFFQFLFTPFLRLVRFYKYLTPMVLSIIYSEKNIELHNGLTIDYLMYMKWSDRGTRAQKILWINYFKAFLKLIDMTENGLIPQEAAIKGHSYFFNNRTAERLGFSVEPASFFWKINSVLNGLEIIGLYSYSQGKWAIPKLWNVKTATTTAEKLVSKKELIQNLAERFKRDLETA